MRFRFVSATALLVAVPGISQALGLGDETVRSYLNAPLNAEIELFATPEELATFSAQLASRDDFIRHGLDYPGFLTGIQVRPERLSDGRNILRLTSSQPIVEPFVVLLVDVRSDGGRLLREYTLLLDPPTFQPQAAPPPPVAAPVSGEAPGTTIRPATPVAPPPAAPAPQRPATVAPAVAPAPPPAPSGGGGQYTVQRGDTLSSIAAREYGAEESARAMIAIFRANPDAFGGNINQLRAGARLALPGQDAVAALSRSEALSEVRNQMSAWTGSSQGTGEGAAARLRLVPPAGPAGDGESGEAAGSSAGGAGAAPATGPDRPIAIESPELARLPTGQPPGEPGSQEAAAEPTDEAEGSGLEAQSGAETTATEPAATEPVREAAPAAADESGPGLLDRLKEYWVVALGGVGILLALLGLVAVRRRREAASAFIPPTPSLDDFELPAARDSSGDTFPLRKPGDSRDSNIVVEETSPHDRTGAHRQTRTIDLDDAGDATSATMGSAALEQGDPLAEADFHMAYGLYDQAADLVKAALQREPQRRDLKLKLLEVFFVWGNKDQFLQSARELATTRESSPPGEWEKVVIMGKQLAPEDVLFHQSAVGAQSTVDLNLEGGQNLVDFDLPDLGGESLAGGTDVDVNVGSATDAGLTPLAADSGLDFVLDDPARGEEHAPTATTRQMAQPGLDSINAPTIEQPALDIGDTLAGKLDAHLPFTGSPDQTAELALDDLGLDLGKLEATGTGMLAPDIDETTSDAATLVAGLDETSRELLAGADASQRTEMLPLTDLDLSGMSSGLDMDFGSGDTGKSPALETGTGLDLDLDVGAAETPAAGDDQKTQRIDPTVFDAEATETLEPVTMSEVGTKLDLARAYMDMGDPDGARSILGEVLQEGSESQRQEAQRLLNSIPGQ